MAGGATNKGRSVPPLLRIPTSRVNGVASTRSVATMVIDLPHLTSHRLKEMRIRDRPQSLRGPAQHALVISIGDRHEDTRVTIRGRTKHDPLFGLPEAPGVVVRRPHKFDFHDVRRILRIQPKAEESHAKTLLLFALNHWLGKVVTLHGPNPIIEPVLEVTHTAMRISQSPV